MILIRCYYLDSFYHVKNEGCLLEVIIMRLFNRTLSIYEDIFRYSGFGARTQRDFMICDVFLKIEINK